MSQLDLLSQGESEYESLDQLFKKMKRMKDDPLADAGTNIVISRGNPAAKLMIVGG
jgi:uracil-DNA glycosylase